MEHVTDMTAPAVSPFVRMARWTGADDESIAAARIATAPRLFVAGRLASGKDTVAAAVMRALEVEDPVRISFAAAVRDELDTMLDIVRTAPNRLSAASTALDFANVAREAPVAAAVHHTVDACIEAVALDHAVTAHHRTSEIRLALQTWSTDVRRAVDDDYWSRRGLRAAVAALAGGAAVYIADGRFRNEADAASALGFCTVRLDVPVSVRAERLLARDGLVLDPTAEEHRSEQELDDYAGFDLRFDNAGTVDAAVTRIVELFACRAASSG